MNYTAALYRDNNYFSSIFAGTAFLWVNYTRYFQFWVPVPTKDYTYKYLQKLGIEVKMVARSCLNLLDLVSGDMLNFPQTPRSLQRDMTDPVIMSSGDGKQSNDDESGVFSSE